jgi:hypothetical protein
MPPATTVDRKYLKKLVVETMTEIMDPIEDPELHVPKEELVGAMRTQAKEHKRKFEDQIKNLSPAAKWVLTTNPRISRRNDKNPLVFDANGEMEKLFEVLEQTEINSNREQSIGNISAAIGQFVETIGNDKILRALGGATGHERASSEEYAEAFWNYLYERRGTDLNTNMDKEMTKLLNFRGIRFGGKYTHSSVELAREGASSFRDFYYAAINDVNKSAPKAAMHYIAWQIAKDEDFRETVSIIFLPISIALGFASAPLVATFVTGTWALIFVEVILWEFLIPMILGGDTPGIPTVSITYEDVVKPLDDLLKSMNNTDDPKVSEEELETYNDAVDLMDKHMSKYIADWSRAGHPEGGGPLQLKKIKAAVDQKADATDVASLNRKYMIRAIKNKREEYNNFFRGLDRADPKVIELAWAKAMEIHMQQIGRSLKSAASAHSDMQRMAGPSALVKEGARVDTISGKHGIDEEIKSIIGIYNVNKVGPMAGEFMRIYNNWARRSKDEAAVQRTTQKNLQATLNAAGGMENTWSYIQRNYSDLKPAGVRATASALLTKLMKKGWCVYARIPLYVLTGKRRMLSLGIVKKGKSGGAVFGSFFSGRGSGAILDGFMKMIKYGAIGIDPSGKIVPPEHDGKGIAALSRLCTKKGRDMAGVAETIELEFKSAKIEENFYNRRMAFANAYSQFYLELGIILHRCSSSQQLGGYCGGVDLPRDIHNSFEAATAWHNEVAP